MKIKSVKAVKIKDSNGKDAIEVIINNKYRGSAPAGTSTGKHEVVAYPSKGLSQSINFVNKLNKQLKNTDFETFEDLEELENELLEYDSTSNISKIGGNTIIALEYALLKGMFGRNHVYKGLTKSWKVPMPLGNIIGGGAHAKDSCDVQEFLLLPKAKTFAKAINANRIAHEKVGNILKTKKDQENAWKIKASAEQILDLLTQVCDEVKDQTGVKINLGMDVAANSLYKSRRYYYKKFSRSHNKFSLSAKEQIEWINSLIKRYNLVYVEDPLHEEDFRGFGELNEKAMICGDDLICTNLERLKKAKGKINAVIVKPNQIGSLIETKKLIDYAFKNKITPILSHRAGETLDTTISHLAVAWKIPIVKFGIDGKFREAKLNEIARIERAAIKK